LLKTFEISKSIKILSLKQELLSQRLQFLELEIEEEKFKLLAFKKYSKKKKEVRRVLLSPYL
jgi:hypothetical protein